MQDRLRKEILDALEETDGKITYEMVCKHVSHTFLFTIKKKLNKTGSERL